MTTPSPFLQSDNICELEPETHTYSVVGIPIPLHVTQVLSLSGIRREYPKAAMPYVEHRRELGTRFHQWAQYIDEEKKPKIDSLAGAEVLPYVLGYQKYRAEHRPEWMVVERSYWREDCAGTVDRIGYMENGGDRPEAVIVDLKTASEPEVDWGVQLTAYQWLTQYFGANLYVVWITEDAEYKLLNYSRQTELWQAALILARWQMLGRRR